MKKESWRADIWEGRERHESYGKLFLTMSSQHLSQGLPWPWIVANPNSPLPFAQVTCNPLESPFRYRDRSLGVDRAPTLGSEPLNLSAVGKRQSNASLRKLLKG